MAFPSLVVTLVVVLLVVIEAVDRTKFRTCQTTEFCRTFRQRNGDSNIAVVNQSIHLDERAGILTAQLKDFNSPEPLNLRVFALSNGGFRIKIHENTPRWQPDDLLMPHAMDAGHFTELTPQNFPKHPFFTNENTWRGFSINGEESEVLMISLSPLQFHVVRDDTVILSLNDQALLHYQQTGVSRKTLADGADAEHEEEDIHQGKEIVDYGENGLAVYADGTRQLSRSTLHDGKKTAGGDSFAGHHDSRPFGPQSVGIDISFPGSTELFGIPEHTTSFALPTTRVGSSGKASHFNEPFRLYSLDVFEFELDEPMALYGSVPFLWGQSVSPSGEPQSIGVFWYNPTETFVDIMDGGSSDSSYKQAHLLSEAGEVDLFVFPGPSTTSVLQQYANVVGTQQLPPMFSLGFHQCRWNYRDERDVAEVHEKFDELDFPLDVLWLDIEHTDGKRYFTWDPNTFPTPEKMIAGIVAKGRKLVTIVDPHIKIDPNYHVFSDAKQNNHLVLSPPNDASKKPFFEGWCWPGSSAYIDFTSATTRQWWAEQFAYDKYIGSSDAVFTWNDMNEPSVFNGPEISMPKDARSTSGREHREWHNLYGLYNQMATAQGHIHRSIAAGAPSDMASRPFVLTRSFWAGSQRHGAMWTGDNTGNWEHLQSTVPMLLSINLAGFSFSGADIGGFFGNPDAELFTRWFAAGAFMPFFRSHAHIETKRREPWVFGEPYLSITKSMTALRYSLLPFWYSTFFDTYVTGAPVMRPLFLDFPEQSARLMKIDNTYLIGSSLLVHPITAPGMTTTQVPFPFVKDTCNDRNLPWYDLLTLKAVYPDNNTGLLTVDTPLESIPTFIRPGAIIPRKLRLRRSTQSMVHDPYTLVVTPGSCGIAEGQLYIDDETTLAHERKGAFTVRKLHFNGTILKNTAGATEFTIPGRETLVADPRFAKTVSTRVERIIIAGIYSKPAEVTVSIAGETTSLNFQLHRDSLLIKAIPSMLATVEWTVTLAM